MSINSEKVAAYRRAKLTAFLDLALTRLEATGQQPKGSKEYYQAIEAKRQAFMELYLELDRLSPIDILPMRGIV